MGLIDRHLAVRGPVVEASNQLPLVGAGQQRRVLDPIRQVPIEFWYIVSLIMDQNIAAFDHDPKLVAFTLLARGSLFSESRVSISIARPKKG